MAQVDFYIVSSPEEKHRRETVCRLADKARRLGHRVFIHTESDAQARELDQLLWTFREDSFVPHALAAESNDDSDRILIGAGTEPAGPVDVLINLTRDVPLCAEHCQRIAEVVGGGEASRAEGRQRFRRYREHGHQMKSHAL